MHFKGMRGAACDWLWSQLWSPPRWPPSLRSAALRSPDKLPTLCLTCFWCRVKPRTAQHLQHSQKWSPAFVHKANRLLYTPYKTSTYIAVLPFALPVLKCVRHLNTMCRHFHNSHCHWINSNSPARDCRRVSPGARHGYGLKNDVWTLDSHLIHSCTLW